MKSIFKYSLVLLILPFLITSCNESEDVVTSNAKEAARISLMAGSTGQLAGAPQAGVDLSDAEVEFQASILTYAAAVESGGSDIQSLTVYKSYAGSKVIAGTGTVASGVSLSYSSVEEFIEGMTGVSSTDLRIGDVVSFYTEITMNDGRVILDNAATLNIGISCLADLSGVYNVTNSGCSNDTFPFEVTITKNADGTWHLTSADGGFLHRCTGNSTLINAGNITEQCGEILAGGDLDFGSANSSYDIGEIVGGSWDAATGTLILEQGQSFTGNWASEWVSTYVRQ